MIYYLHGALKLVKEAYKLDSVGPLLMSLYISRSEKFNWDAHRSILLVSSF